MKKSYSTPARTFDPGMGVAVAERTILRTKENGERETWADVAKRVATGNALLAPNTADFNPEFDAMHHHLRQASLLMSGRHLQHGDETQPSRNMEVMTNCSTAAASFVLFYLLLNGSGVGRAYDDHMMVVDWRNLPEVFITIDADYPDRVKGLIPEGTLSLSDFADEPGDINGHTIYHVEDSREGWGYAVEFLETLAYGGNRQGKVIIDFSHVRPNGSPIKGMQNRPSSGPGATMQAMIHCANLRDCDYEPWKQAMYVDHYLAESVLVGGARRAARMATKEWRDASVLDFIAVKKGGVLWSSNNSVTVDEEFWKLVGTPASGVQWESEETKELWGHAKQVFEAVCHHSYHDGTGEPGFINQDKLTAKMDGIEIYDQEGPYLGSAKFKPNVYSEGLLTELMDRFKSSQYKQITNPCVTADTWIHTSEGPRQVSQLLNSSFKAIVNGEAYDATAFWKTGDKPVFKVTTDRGFEIEATDNHRLLVETSRRRKGGAGNGYNVESEWVGLKDLQPGDKLVLGDNSGVTWGNKGDFDRGWLLGEMVGDGGYNPDLYRGYVRFWGENRDQLASLASAIVGNSVTHNIINETAQVQGTYLNRLADGLITSAKTLLPKLECQSSDFCAGFLRGLFDADGSVQGSVTKGVSVRFWQADRRRITTVQRMLARLGIVSTIYFNREDLGERNLPDGRGGLKSYLCSAGHELVISKDNITRFAETVGFYDENKTARLSEILGDRKRPIYKERFTAEVVSINSAGVQAVYDCTVDDVHRFDANGIIAHNCGEITLTKVGGYCVIADVVPYHAQDLDDAEDAFRVATRALIRTNLMDCLYRKEVDRTNRIGVGMTGFHEFAWKFFGYGFRDIIDEAKSLDFWYTVSRFARAVKGEAASYSKYLGVNTPHTDTTFKPAGTTSKLFGLTEGAHLPAMAEYLRYVQFRHDDPRISDYRAAGYPIKDLVNYKGTTVVGFPTIPEICKLGMGDKMVTASEATPEEQYQFLRLLEKYWIRGVNEQGEALPESGNQISFTLKYDPKIVSYEEFRRTLAAGQSSIRCCSVMPMTDTSAYEYLPEQPVSKEEFAALVAKIERGKIKEEVGFEHIDCGSGACPIDFVEGDRSNDWGATEAAESAQWMVFTGKNCPACKTAKQLLTEADVIFEEIELVSAQSLVFMRTFTDSRTVPIIVHGKKFVGDLAALQEYLPTLK